MSAMDRSLVPLQQANLCLDCDIISTGHTYCHACGSTALLNLARTLDGRDYCNSVPQAFAEVARISAVRDLEGQNSAGRGHRDLSQFVGLATSRVQASSEADSDQDEDLRWRSFRGLASIAQRAITMALFAALLGR